MSDDTFVPLSNPVASTMAKLEANMALRDSDRLRFVGRAIGSDALLKLSAQRLVDYEKHAEDSQLWA